MLLFHRILIIDICVCVRYKKKEGKENDTFGVSSLGNGRRVERRYSQVAGGGSGMMMLALFSGTLYL